MESIFPELLKLGAPGLLCIFLIWAWANAEKRYDKAVVRIEQLHEAFYKSATETVKHIEGNTNALTAIRAMQQEREDATRQLQTKLEQIAFEIKGIHTLLSRRRSS